MHGENPHAATPRGRQRRGLSDHGKRFDLERDDPASRPQFHPTRPGRCFGTLHPLHRRAGTAHPPGFIASITPRGESEMSERRFLKPLLAIAFTFAAASVAASPIEEIVVTATKRVANVQDVPVAVTALSSIQLDRAGVKDLRDLPTLSPSFNMNASQTESQGSTLRLRGVGTTGNNIGLESAVGVFIDGVYISRPGVALGDLFDVKQIEVLRGPQGTLFGQNTSAGALSIKTKKPLLDDTEFWASGTAGNYDSYDLKAGGNIPLIPGKLGLRLAGAVRKQDGFVHSLTSSGESMNRDRQSFRGQLLWEPTDAMSFRLIGDYSNADENCCDAAIQQESPLVAAGAFAAAGLPANAGVVASGDRALKHRQTNGSPFKNPFKQYGLSLEWNWDTDLGTVTYLGSYRSFKADSVQDSEYVGADVYRVQPSYAGGYKTYDDIKNWTNELRMQGVNGRLDWLVGGYFSNEQIVEHQGLGLGADYGQYVSATGWYGAILPLVGSSLDGVPLTTGGTFGDVTSATNPAVAFAGGVDPAGSYAQNNFQQDARTWSVFTHDTYSLTDKLDLVLGLRWTDEHKAGSFVQAYGQSPACANTLANAAGLPSAASQVGGIAVALMCFPFATQVGLSPVTPAQFDKHFNDNELVYTLKSTYAFTDDVNGYASFTHGFKSGGFNLDSTAAAGGADPRFLSEKTDAWELGVKSDLFDHTVRANAALFYMQMHNFQVLEFTGVQFKTFNVDKAVSKGLEIETETSPIDGLDLSLDYTYADARYPGDCNGSSTAPSIVALCGQNLTNAPHHVVVAGVNYERPIGATDLSWFVNTSTRWESNRRTSTQAIVPGTNLSAPVDSQHDNAKVNLRLGVEKGAGQWSLELWGNNLFDKQTKNVTFNVPLRGIASLGTAARGVFFDAPRTYGITLRTQM
ncbi:MAG: TonB-dependent receptor [Tepidisphaera sp.]|nr:TonB-dependent receptor [Tepidisphaera sp.]